MPALSLDLPPLLERCDFMTAPIVCGHKLLTKLFAELCCQCFLSPMICNSKTDDRKATGNDSLTLTNLQTKQLSLLKLAFCLATNSDGRGGPLQVCVRC